MGSHAQPAGAPPPLRLIDHAMEDALRQLRTLVPKPAQVPLHEAFNWSHIATRLPLDGAGDWFVVAFRSTRKVDADAEALYAADAAAHDEAWNSGGLLTYYFGDLDTERSCLAMCIWAHLDWARMATTLPKHQHAVSLAGRMYEHYTLERYRLEKHAGAPQLQLISLGTMCSAPR